MVPCPPTLGVDNITIRHATPIDLHRLTVRANPRPNTGSLYLHQGDQTVNFRLLRGQPRQYPSHAEGVLA